MSLVEETKQVLEKVAKLNAKYSFMSVISEELALKCAKFADKHPNLPLSGYYITIKDCVIVKDVESTASSRILKGYKPVFDATVVKKIKEAGGIIIGKTLQDEFGFGSFSINTGLDYETPKNAHDTNRVAGGSSGGSAVATAVLAKEGIKHIAIAESTGGSIECPAAFNGVIGFCPTYGKVSRNGLISYANSLDKIGVMATSVDETLLSLNIISGKDDGDSTSVETKEVTIPNKKLKIGIITTDVKPDVKEAYEFAINTLKEHADIEEVSLPFTSEFALSTYYILAMSEASTNLSSLCGLRYGQQDLKKDEHFADYFKRIRSKHFGKEVKRRIMLGTFTRMAGYRDAFYIRAAKARTTIIEEYKKLFETYDVLLSPTMPFTPPTFDDVDKLKPIDHYTADQLTVGPNLAGIPHSSFPLTNTVGIMAMANHFEEGNVLAVGKILEEINK